MTYWGVPKDLIGNHRMDDRGDNIANYVRIHLFIYQDLKGTIPPGCSPKGRLHVGKGIQVPVELKETDYFKDYRGSVTLLHFRGDEDQRFPLSGLLKKYPYKKLRQIVSASWK